MTDSLDFRPHRETVLKDWLDYNGHLNESYYLLVFSHATDNQMDQIGLDHKAPERRAASTRSTPWKPIFAIFRNAGRAQRLK